MHKGFSQFFFLLHAEIPKWEITHHKISVGVTMTFCNFFFSLPDKSPKNLPTRAELGFPTKFFESLASIIIDGINMHAINNLINIFDPHVA